MPAIMKISPQGQIRIPKQIMQSLGLLLGDFVELCIENDQIVLKPRKLIDPTQGWHWTKEWQQVESDVDSEIKNGKISPKFRTAEEGAEWLKK